MAFSLNKVILIGNLGKDAETKMTQNNLSVTTFSVATTNSYKGKDGSWINETTWHNVVSFSLPDFYKEKLTKGKKIYVEGRIQKKDYTDKEGVKRYVIDIISEKLITLDASGNKNRDEFNSTPHNESLVPPQHNEEEGEDLPF